MAKAGATFGIIGALSAFPRRLAARAVSARGGQVRRGSTRRINQIVLGRTLLDKLGEAEIEARLDALRDAGARVMSENGFLRALGLLTAPEGSALSRQSLLDQSRIAPRAFDMLALFDAFEHDSEPFSFRDLILAKKYAGLIAGGASWSAVARSVHRSGPVASLTALSLHPGGPSRIYAGDAAGRTELDGQRLLALEPPTDDTEEYFVLAENAEAAKLYAEATVLYQHCLALDPGDSVAAFNRANCFRALGEFDEAALGYLQAIKRDPGFVEAWFNYAGLLREQGKIGAARQHLERAIALDETYADAVYNLATLEFEAGNLGEARRWWRRYLELDHDSEWSRSAARGVQFVDMQLNQKRVGQ